VSAPENKPQQSAPSRRSWADLGPRLASAVVLIAVAVLALYAGGIVFACIIGAVFAGCYREWETMVARRTLSVPGWIIVALVAISGCVFPWFGWPGTGTAIAAAVVVAIAFGGEGIVWRVVGLLFFGLVIGAVLSMRGTGVEGIYAGLILAAVIWMTDSSAFFAGRQIGGEKLAPQISPSKTWSGAVGGLALGTISGITAWIFLTDSPVWIGALLAMSVSIVGQLGDLVESAIKRHFRVKDSGDIIPGHGGLMDRLDSLTFGVLFLFLVGLAHGGWSNVAAGFLDW